MSITIFDANIKADVQIVYDGEKIINRNIMNGKHIKYSVDNDGIAFVTWDVADSPVNIMNEHTMAEFFQL
jgi:hypothetical protein